MKLIEKEVSIPENGVIPFELNLKAGSYEIESYSFNPREWGNTVRTMVCGEPIKLMRLVSIPENGVIPFER